MNASLQDDPSPSCDNVPVAVAERHVHLTQDVIEQLFCDKYHLHEHARASQPTQFAAREVVTLVGPGGRLANVRVIGPPRAHNQIEISRTDAATLGVRAPQRESGDLKDTPGIFVEGPRTGVRLDHGVIRTLRHVHMTPEHANRIGVKDRGLVDVVSASAHRRTVFCDVLVRVTVDCVSELHIDADESEAAGLYSGSLVELRRNLTHD